MPLRGLFSKRNKSRTDVGQYTPASPTATESTVNSPTADYIKPDSLLPSSPNGRSTLHPDSAFTSPSKSTKSSIYPSIAASPPSSSSKLRLPFGRKRAAKSSSSNNGRDEDSDITSASPHPPFTGRLSTSVASESDAASFRRKLGPPPSRSAIFSAYGDSHSASSTRSLPNDYPVPVPPNETLVQSQTSAPKRPLFPWSSKSQPSSTKAKAESKSSPLKAEDISTALEDSSFNLKSFRHLGDPVPLPRPVRSQSTIPDSANSSSTSLVPPGPLTGSRSRNASLSSINDPSVSQQRISVAAFREAQARRSLAGSPVPSPRSPSPGPNLSVHNRSPPLNQASDVRQRRTSLVALGSMRYSSEEEDSSENEEEEDSDTSKRMRGRPGKKNTVKSKAKSEAGHNSSSHKTVPSAFHGLNTNLNSSLRPDAAAKIATPRSRSDIYGQGVYGNQPMVPASASTGAVASETGSESLTSFEAPQRSNPREVKPAISTRPSSKAISQSESDSDDSDNAPLATLVPPKRPGSSASTRSNPQSDAASIHTAGRPGGLRARINSNAMPKPLIDINELTAPKRRSIDGGKLKSQDGFTGGATLLSAGTTQGASSMMAMSPVPSSVTSTSPPGRRFVSPPPSPVSNHPPKLRSESISSRSPSQAPSGLVQRRIPKGRNDPDTSSTVSSTTVGSSNDGSSGGRKKDPLSERLSKVVAQSVNSSPTVSQPPPNPLSGPLRRGKAPTYGSNVRSTSSGDFDIPFTSSPSPTFEMPTAIDRKSSGEVGVDSYFPKEPAVRAFSPKPSTTPKPVDAPLKRSVQVRKSEDSTEAMADLADLLGAGIKLVSVNGEDQSDEDMPFGRHDTEEKEDADSIVHLAYDPPPSPNRITPVVVKTRPPASSFSVTSRPPHARGASINILTTSTSGTVMDTVTGNITTATTTTTTTTQNPARGPPLAGAARPRSSTLVPVSPSKTNSSTWSSTSRKAKPPSSNTLHVPGSSVASSSSISSSSTSNSGKSTNRNAGSSHDSSLSHNRGQLVTKQRPAASKPPPRSMSANQLPPPMTSSFPAPSKPFASQSPASSTGDSSSGRGAPITPRDGSDIGDGMGNALSKEEQWGSGVSGLSFATKHGRKRSIAFDEDTGNEGKGKNKSKETPEDGEARRKDRRRSEARAAIELGNTINGPGPVLDDDEEEDLPVSQTSGARMNGMSPMMMNGPMPGIPGMLTPQMTGNPMWGWAPMPSMPQIAPGQMLSPAQFMVPPPTDPTFFAAHQQAMMYAKQAYQMAVAQQAMAAAAEEWERGSTVGGFSSSQSMYGMPPSTSSIMGSPYGMSGGNGWSTGSTLFPSSASRSPMYGSGAMSEYGGGTRSGGWNSSRSVYGESFGPTSPSRNPGAANRGRMSSYTRDPGHYPPMPPMPPQGNNKNIAHRQAANARARTVSQPANPVRSRNAGSPAGKAPPSSWRLNDA
ncbi:hypothetical protein EV368DRAFT_63678 [Lentinula lateritia]|nr:hypothetical protein EV368DRAFT_63678 [Lentinula lateritia]